MQFMSKIRRGGQLVIAGVAVLCVAGPLSAQCTTSWSALGQGVNNTVNAMTVSAGPGGSLYATGAFSQAGGAAANRVARWNGSAWSPLGDGINDVGYAIVEFDDGTGPAIYVGGQFTLAGTTAVTNIAKWNGSTWTAVGGGTNGIVRALAVHDEDGAGPNPPRLFAAGEFTMAGGVAANRIARWNGTAWSAMGNGMNNTVHCLAVFSPTTGGTFLFAGGAFTTAGTANAARVARWTGTTWSILTTGANNTVHAMGVFTPPASSAFLYLGGDFTSVGGVGANRIARWSGTAWAALGAGVNDTVKSLASFNDGSTTQLYVGGEFTNAGGGSASRIARWSGTAWSALGSGVTTSPFVPTVNALAVYDVGGAGLIAGGFFTLAGGQSASRIARWGCPIVLPPECPADLDGSGVVNGLDLASLLGAWTGPAMYSPCPPHAPADLNQDCRINGLDLASLLGAWGPCGR